MPVLGNPHSETGFPGAQKNLLSCSICPLSLVPSLGTPRKSLALSCLQPPLEFLWNCCRGISSDPSEKALHEPSLQVEQFLLLQHFVVGEMLPALYHRCDPLRGCLQCIQVSPTREPRTGQSCRFGFISAEQGARITSLGLLVTLLLLQPRSPLPACAATALSCFTFNSETVRTAGLFSAKLLSHQGGLQHAVVPWVALALVQDFASPRAELPEVPVAHFSSLSRSLWRPI